MTEQLIDLIVEGRRVDCGDILRLALKRADGGSLPASEAGAHIELALPNGADTLYRQYSLYNDPAEKDVYRLGVLKDPNGRGGSTLVHELAQIGAKIAASTPRNHFPLVESAERTVLIGGGIGITPMIAMAWRLQALGCDFELHYCARSRSRAAFLDLLNAAPFAHRVSLHFDDEDSAFDPQSLPYAAIDTHVYVCGPQGFMDWIIDAAEAAGHAPANVHREYFNAAVDASGEAFLVEARASGVIVTVGPDCTIVKALADVGINIEVKCEEGVCGTCLVDVLEGTPDHRDYFLTDEEKAENVEMTVCCSRAHSKKLVLDI
ncbi:PDR/VanB family oxidoreductase [Sulfitobacter sp. F26204]|uniref:PDR/VanB family oxidoreductase n=1 Tax=Sulfitobacter sp. F26204 TaxID=2996014 RepID=UPI00225DD8D5|nr:PDR/VanB family oxidoreductase [Sulfitobacter sp. F26204]MCX7561722.1 PDR/VanB family oxidoreductase [Sulfitobacter sp. F26204]